jgi:hypothetical protein
MEPDEIDTAIAVYLGWSKIEPINDGRLYGVRPSLKTDLYRVAAVPQYHKCLNAMHDAEKGLAGQLRIAYSNILTSSGRLREFSRLSSCALRRAHAYLRVIGKWHDPSMDAEDEAVAELSTDEIL